MTEARRASRESLLRPPQFQCRITKSVWYAVQAFILNSPGDRHRFRVLSLCADLYAALTNAWTCLSRLGMDGIRAAVETLGSRLDSLQNAGGWKDSDVL